MYSQKISATAVISKDDRYINEVKASGLFETYKIDFKDGILGAVETALSQTFKSVYTEGESTPANKVDFIVETALTIDLISKKMGRFYFFERYYHIL